MASSEGVEALLLACAVSGPEDPQTLGLALRAGQPPWALRPGL